MASKKKKIVSRPKRKRYPMPAFVRNALRKHGAVDAYERRPAYQQNDYIGWIVRAVLPATKKKRLDQMLAELKRGDRYMKMSWSPRRF